MDVLKSTVINHLFTGGIELKKVLQTRLLGILSFFMKEKENFIIATVIKINERKCINIIIPNILLELSLLNVFIKGFVSWLDEHVVLDYKFCLYRKAAFWALSSLHTIILFVIYVFVYCYTHHYLTNYFFRHTRSAQIVTDL